MDYLRNVGEGANGRNGHSGTILDIEVLCRACLQDCPGVRLYDCISRIRMCTCGDLARVNRKQQEEQ